MITRKALRASAKARKEGGNSYAKVVRQGEVAAITGLPKSSNPYSNDWSDAWDFGFEGIMEDMA